MPFSHHSHSGQFCAHAVDTLEEVVKMAVAKGFHTFALTEHVYRGREDFYPEEEDVYTEESLKQNFEAYIVEATRLKTVYASQINIIVGFESEWIRPRTGSDIQDILAKHADELDFFLGSVHHVLGFPIDFDREKYELAREKAGGTDEKQFMQYFKEMKEMLEELRPPVVGHFDLIRLKSDTPDTQFQGMDEVWIQIRKNLDFIASYGGILELNSAGLRKGLAEPYPGLDICQYFSSIGGRFTMSDDSHGTAQVGTNYARLLAFIKKAGIKEMWYADIKGAKVDERFRAGFSKMSTEELKQHPFWATTT